MNRRYLLIGAHPDDIEMGCLASILHMHDKTDRVFVFVASICDIDRMAELKDSMYLLELQLDCDEFTWKVSSAEDMYIHKSYTMLREQLDHIRDKYKPTHVFMPSRKDLHQDHSFIGELALSVFRHSSCVSYEVVRSLIEFTPNYYVKIDKKYRLGLHYIGFYESQSHKYYMSSDVVKAQLRHRGSEIGVEYAQAFEILRWIE